MRLPYFILFCLGLSWLQTSAALTFSLPPEGEDLVGELIELKTRYEDTFSDIARGHDMGFREVSQANPGVDAWLPGEGTEIFVPQLFILPDVPREGVVINLAELRLYYYPKDQAQVITYPLGIGREGWGTPEGATHVIRKRAHPSWYVPESIRQEHQKMGDPLPEVMPPGPDNPLGEYAVYLGMRGYLLHGTNKPYGVGMRVSHGCIRLYPEDIEEFFRQIPVNTPVRIINRPYKAGWRDGQLYVEAHPPLNEQIKVEGRNHTGLVTAMITKLGEDRRQPDWDILQTIARDQTGIPEIVPLSELPGDN